MTACRFRIVTDEAAFFALEPQWNELYQQSTERYYSESFDWCRCGWLTVAKPRGGKLHCLIGSEGDRIVLIWPLVIHRKHVWSIARPLGSESTEYSNVLIEDGPGADARMDLAWRALTKAPPFSVLQLPFVRDGSRLHRLIATRKALSFATPYTTSLVDWMASPDWDTYRRSLNNRQRLDLARRRRRLTEAGNVTVAAVVDADQQTAVIDWLVQQKRRWLDSNDIHNDWLVTAEYRNFLVAIAERSRQDGRVVVSALKLDDSIIAASVARADGGRLEKFMSSFDPAYRKFSPSHLLAESLFQWCFERGFEVDLRLGDETFKKNWHLRRSRAASYDIAASAWGMTFVLLKRARRGWKRLKPHLSRGRLRPEAAASVTSQETPG